MVIESFAKRTKLRCQFLGRSDARVIASVDEAAGIGRLRTGDHSRAHAAKSSTGQALLLLPIRGKHSRVWHTQRQTAAKVTAFMTGIRSFMKAHAILWQKLRARFSEHIFDQANRALVSRAATDPDIRDPFSMKTGRLSRVPNRPIERSTPYPNLCAPQEARNAKQSNQGGSK